MKRLCCIFAIVSLCVSLWAIPAKPVRRTICVESREVSVTLTGDEKLHYWLSDDGKAYRETADGSFVPFVPTMTRTEQQSSTTRALSGPKKEPIVGNRRGLVILVETPDVQFTCSSDPNATFSAMMNEEGYHEGTATGSVRDYFLAQSYGLLDYTFDVVGPVMVSHEMSYYGDNDRFAYEACSTAEMIVEAVQLADSVVDYTLYDMDGDKKVDNIYIIYAGYAESSGNLGAIWPHAYELSSAGWWNKASKAQTCDGVKIDSYACSSEFRGTKGGKIDGIGSFCHEFSHCLGLPDLYNVSTPSNYTLGYWDVMDTGCYNNDGDTPPSYSAYERWFCGWLTPEELSTDTAVIDLRDIDESAKSFVYYNEANHNEFYLVQNIRKTGWNKYLAGEGVAVYHVDYSQNIWSQNAVNGTPSHLRLSLIKADNKGSYASESTDLYPSKQGNNAVSDTSRPAATVFNKNIDGTKFMGKNLTDIYVDAEGNASFSFWLSDSLKEALGLGIAQTQESTDNGKTLLFNAFGQQVTKNYKGFIVTSDGRKILAPHSGL